MQKRHEETNQKLFQSIWGNSEWTAEEDTQAQAFLSSSLLRSIDLCLVVSAVTMSLQACFDIRKCLWTPDSEHVPRPMPALSRTEIAHQPI